MRPARILSIAGSDSSGGAGIQADIKTAGALGAYAMTAITAITAQDTTGVGAIVPIAPEVVAEQITRCLTDIGADAIKTGMLGSAAIVATVANALDMRAKGVPLVVDPVMVATSGAVLAADDVVEAMKTALLPRATLITPNLPEAARLCGFALENGDDLMRAGGSLLALGPKAVLIKGGHGGSDTLTDILFTHDADPRAYVAKRVETKSTHGTGCTLSTAIACGLGQGMPLADAIQRAHAYVQRAIRTAPGFGAGNGPLNHLLS
ncbi:MAG: bifunctional hydroxymethylpyrimidine kinase/phosphomethylpyrimidine kinase [Alphaproteobacteria bacterium]|nr:bifunctional hydroxymethylpyrimidine kinase/phosphomethylpyrimidine kinase [Alphaproteobacteria bacterium]